ncbi:hypothetical protein MTBSS4_60122 [Magnetospirillum sp. SS-4]|nr:hypothetical protein MTBSS4_60122 [Magnetospirillum sp. SS-4]
MRPSWTVRSTKPKLGENATATATAPRKTAESNSLRRVSPVDGSSLIGEHAAIINSLS